ncbi:MAG TPA: ABC transporter substrate-binding protein [Stellaceae bacterium]|jgi:branched-chain amino acid transport system substrate-binding protein|nr:ABC transporter substrate-binding protein [Stellaceae bacterium]
MRQLTRRSILAAAPAAALALRAWPARAKEYGPGVTDTEIKIGNTVPYSGPGSSYGTIGKAQTAYYKLINDKGGINGRKVNFLSYDDAYTPPKTVEQVRKLVEQDQVLFIESPLGTPTNSAIWHYMNQKKVPQLFVATGATKWNDPKGHPWTMGWQPNYQSEGRIYATYVLEHKPDGKIGVLFQNDDFGKDYLKGIKDGLGDKNAKMIVVEGPYETTDPTVDSQIVSMKSAGCDVFINCGIPKFAAQGIRKAAELDWKPLNVLSSVGNSVGAALKPAGLENAKDIVSDFYMKDPTDPAWKDDAGLKEWLAFMDKYYPDGDKTDVGNVIGYSQAQTAVQVLTQCGDTLTRENVMKQAANLKDFVLPMTLPGIKLNTSPTDFAPMSQVQMAKFDGTRWQLFGSLLSGAAHS